MDARLCQKAIFSSSLEPHILLEPLRDDEGHIIDFILLDMNDAALATMHTDRRHVIGMGTKQVVPEPVASEMFASYRDIYESGKPFVRDNCLWPPQDPILGRYFDIRAFRANDLLSFSWRDVTDRMMRQKQQEREAARLATIIDAIPSLIWSSRPDGNLDFLNRAWLEYTGMSMEEAKGQGWMHALHPDDTQEEERIWAEARQTGQVFEVEERLLRHDGVYRWFLVRAKPVRDSEGTITAWYGTNVDITDLKESEASLRRTMASLNLAIEAAEIGVWMRNYRDSSFICDERIRGWYEVPEDVHDSRSLNAWIHKHIHPEDATRMEARIHNSRLSGTPFQDEFRIIRSDGSIMYMQAAGLLETDSEGHPLAMIGIHRDITAQRTLEQNLVQERSKLEAAYAELQQHRDHLEDLVLARTRELASARDAAEGADRAKSAFLSTISHEMRTPLNQIMGMTWLLGRAVTEGKSAHYVEAINRASRSLLEMTSSILDFVKVESDTIALKDVEFSLAALLDKVRIDSLDRTGKVGREVHSTVDPALPGIFKGDAIRLGQVLVALVGNALKFSKTGPVTIGVRKVAVLRDRFVVRFEVRDTGIGMTPEVQSELFTLFRQGDSSSTRRYGGLGLGLALAKRIVTLMAGEMGFSSEEGSGSLVWFTVQLEGMERASESSMASRVFMELEVLLAEEDFLAVTLWEESHSALEPFLGAAAGPLAEAIMSFDFMTAQKILREATKSLQG
jgi:PAS domain S-box-containing protein